MDNTGPNAVRDYLVAASSRGTLLILQPAEPPDIGWFLLRYSPAGAFQGDTWHETIEGAESQVASQFGDVSPPKWRKVTGRIAEAIVAARASTA